MQLKQIAMAAILAAPLLGCQTGGLDHAGQAALSVIPRPQAVTAGSGHFVVGNGTPLVCAAASADCDWIADYLGTLVKRTRKITLARQANSGAAAITLRLGGANTGPEGYRLDISGNGIEISANTRAGLFYGGVTLWQLLTQSPDMAAAADLPGLHIADAPRFAMRGLMLDSARHFQSPAFVRDFIDTMALHKLNVLQWHLTDDQGWRLEIKRYPKLTSVGAWRIPPSPSAAIDPATGKPKPYGGFYTQDDVRGIVAYAKARNVTIIPEIEMPGHATAAVVSYPQLGSTTALPDQAGTGWGIFPYLYNVDDSTFDFLQNVLVEVMDLFPSPYIHVGGDEAIKDEWKASPKIQAQMRALGIANEDALQGYFTARIGKFLAAHGRHLIGWDEILQGGVPSDATITSWHGVAGAIAAARTGHDAILSPEPTLYFDNRQAEGAGEPPGRGLIVSLQDVYAFNPAPDGLTREELAHIIGIQANLWTEYVTQQDLADYAIFPRAAALAELAWSPAAGHDWNGFRARLPAQLRRYRALGLRHSESAVAAQVDAQYDPASGHATATLSTQAGLGDIRYTLDGTAPTIHSPLYTRPLDLSLPSHLSAAAFFEGEALAAPIVNQITKDTLRARDSHALKQCSTGAMSIQQEGPVSGHRGVFMINMRNPCWIFEKADLNGVATLSATVGLLPATSRNGANSASRALPAMLPPSTPHGELEAHLDSCEGEKIAVLPLPADTRNGLIALKPEHITAHSGAHDICFMFTRRTLDPVWAVQRVQLGD